MKNKLFILIFLLVISLPLLGRLININQKFQIEENRNLTDSFDDQFGFRPILVKASSEVKLNLFRSSTNDLVALGKDGWLFYRSDDTFLDDIGANNFSPSELAAIRKNLQQTKDYLTGRGIKSYFLIAPKPQDVYAEYLPDYYHPGNTRLKQLQNQFINPTNTLRNSKNLGQLYYKYDTHWNYLGAYVAYRELMKQMRITPLGPEDFNLTYQPSQHKDLAILLGVSDFLSESEPILTPKKPESHQTSPLCSNIYAQCLEVTTKANIPKTNRVLVYRDSFGTFLIPYISETFSDVHYIWRLPPHPTDVIEQEKPDIVIFEMTERDLSWLLNPLLKLSR